MMKTLTLASAFAALAIAGTAAVAQPVQPASPGGDRGSPPPVERLSKEDRAALFDARMAAVPAGLGLTDAQKKLWAPVEKAMRENESHRLDRFDGAKDRAAGSRPDYLARLQGGAERMTESANRMTALLKAMKPFWASLNEKQKRLFPMLVHQGANRDGKPAPQGAGPRPAAPAQPRT